MSGFTSAPEAPLNTVTQRRESRGENHGTPIMGRRLRSDCATWVSIFR